MYQDKLSLLNGANATKPVATPITTQLTLFSPTPSHSTTTAAPADDDGVLEADISKLQTHSDVESYPPLAYDDDGANECAATDEPRARGHDESPRELARGHDDAPRERARVRPSARVATYAQARRRSENAALARSLFDADGEHTFAFLPHDDGVPFAGGPIARPALESFFAEPLPIGTACVIPTGTGELLTAKDEHPMNELDPQLVDAIDAGSSDVGRQSPLVAFFLRNSRAISTRKLYRWAWTRVLRSCMRMNRCAMPMSEATAALVIVDGVNDGLVVGSLRIISSVISVAHALAKQPDPTETEAFRSVMRGIARLLSVQQDQKVALNLDELLQIREACDADPNHTRGIRDWALIAFGFAGAFRRSEIVARNHADIERVGDELRVYLDRSKTDQFGRGAFVRIKPAANPKLCPLLALDGWTAIAPGPGPLFRPISKSGSVLHRRLAATTVSVIVKGFGVVLDLPEDRLGAHSLRAGMVTALLEGGAGEIQTMEHSRHKSHDTLGRYYRPRNNAPNFTTMAGL
jgi:integrase